MGAKALMDINWRDMFSIIISPELLILFSGQSVTFCLQQVGIFFFFFFSEELKSNKVITSKAVKRTTDKKGFFCMMVGLMVGRK